MVQLLKGNVTSDELRTVKDAAGEFVRVNWKLPLERIVGLRRVGGVVLRFALLAANNVSDPYTAEMLWLLTGKFVMVTTARRLELRPT